MLYNKKKPPFCFLEKTIIKFKNIPKTDNQYSAPATSRPGARFTNVLSAKKFVSSFLRTVCVSQTPSTYEFLKDFAKIFLNIVVTLRQGGGDLIFQKIS